MQAEWTFLTNHAHVLLCLVNDPELRLTEIASRVGITERAAHRIVAELSAAGYVSAVRIGRRKRYAVHADRPFRHPMDQHKSIQALLDALTGPPA